MEVSNCINCGYERTGAFCSNCGQKETHRYTVTHVLHELLHVFTHADKGIFSFAKNIIVRPGVVALDLVEGRRKRYFNLFQYLLLIVGFTTFLIVKSNFMENIMQNMNTINNVQMSKRLAQAQADVGLLLQKYNNLFQMMLIPAFALFSWLLIGRKRNYNFAENIVLHTASSAQTNTLGIITIAILLFSKSNAAMTGSMILSFVIMLFSIIQCYRQFYKLSVRASILYSFLVLVCAYIVQSIISVLLVFLLLLVSM